MLRRSRRVGGLSLGIVAVALVGLVAGAGAITYATGGYSIWTVVGEVHVACTALPCGEQGPALGPTVATVGAAAADQSGDIAIADFTAEAVRFVPATTGTFFGQPMTAGHIYTIAGTLPSSGAPVLCTVAPCGDGGAATSAQLRIPTAAAFDGAGDLFVTDDGDNVIRFVPITSGTFYGKAMVADHIYTIAGTMPTSGSPAGVCTAAPCGDGGLATSAALSSPRAVAVDSAGDFAIADAVDNVIRFVPASSGTFYGQTMVADHIYTIAGNMPASGSPATGCAAAPCGDGAGAVAASEALNTPTGVALMSNGSVVISDTNDDVVRFVPTATGTSFGVPVTAGDIYTVAGTMPAAGNPAAPCVTAPCGDGGSGTAAKLIAPAVSPSTPPATC